MSDSGGTHLKRFAVLVKSNAQVEAGTMPTEQDLSAMSRFNDELIESGAMLAGEGFLASAGGARLSYADGGVRVQARPFGDPESLAAGYWIIQAGSLNEAIDLMKRAPMGGGTVEIRQISRRRGLRQGVHLRAARPRGGPAQQDGGKRQAPGGLSEVAVTGHDFSAPSRSSHMTRLDKAA